ncbi:KamA family radical SAM protein [Ancylomarina sp. DW003]|nr:KamA family radical SAM protein [Ancylomarina sp. DW003]MDE5422817.1 KamA family radical SAM protein [Ancylomarina sp. DW003]
MKIAQLEMNGPTTELEELKLVSSKYPVRITKYYKSLIKEKNDAIWKQSMPSLKELEDSGLTDPLSEEHDSPVKCIVHRYPDRVLFYSTSECAMFCRFCTRKRKVGKTNTVSEKDWNEGFEYIKKHPDIRDVIVSGGDPLTLSDERLDFVLSNLRKIKHVQIIRIGTRMLVVNPDRITDKLCSILKQHHPLYINTHFNHPDEITYESSEACNKLANAGIPLGNQSVLLKGVNDDIETMKLLMQKLLVIRVKPYYIYMMDLVQGASHFRTSVQAGLDIIEGLRGHTSGMAIPQLVIDAPHGGGKIPIMPDTISSREKGEVILINFENKHFSYPLE